MSKIANFGMSPQTSKAMDEDEKLEKKLDVEQAGEIKAVSDGRHSRGLPLQLYRHYADIQRHYENTNNFDELYDVQATQLRNEPHSNLSYDKLDSQKKLRLAGYFATCWLITTDILGPSNAPYAISAMGYVPGIILYVVFGACAAFCGWLLNYCFVKVDSNNYPIRTFSDLAGRAVGSWFRYPSALLQFIQMIMNVGLILLTTGQSLAQMLQTNRGCGAENYPDFNVQVIVWAILGMVLGQIRSLSRFSYLANAAVWMNIAICVLTMIASAIWQDPNYALIRAQFGDDYPYNTSSIDKWAILSGPGIDLSSRIDGMNNMVFAWGGATIFCETMAELRRPKDFWKGMLCGQSIILIVYLTFGVFVYSYLGQWCYTAANQAITNPAFQTATNVLNIVSGMLAATLYGNVGLKVLYQGFLVPDFNCPKLTTKKGTILWGVLVIIYWGVAFIIGQAIPLVNTLTTIIGAFCILQFSYTLPPLFTIMLMLREDAAKQDKFDLHTLNVEKADSYFSLSRWKRAWSYGGRLRTFIKVALTLFFMAALALAGLCCYSSLEGAISSYQDLDTVQVFSHKPNIGIPC